MTGRSLKVLLCLEPSGGGSGRHVLDLAEGLLRFGHNVSAAWSPVRAEAGFVTAIEGLTGIEQVRIEMHRAVGAHDLASLAALSRYIEHTGPFDIIHAHSSKAGALVRMLPRRLGGVRIYTPHAFRTMDPGVSALGRMIYGGAERVLSLRADSVIAVSAAEARHALGLGISPSRLHTVVNGVDPVETQSRVQIRQRLDLPQDAPVAGFVGRFSDQKDPMRFVEAVSEARRVRPDLVGLMVGDGEWRDRLEAAAEPGALRFTGWADARALKPAMDTLVMTSRYEAMPYTLLEALSAGLPLICTQVGGVEEVLVHGQNGIGLPVDAASSEIAEALIDLFSDKARLELWRANSVAMSKQYTIKAMVEQTLGVYHAALAARAPEGAPVPAL